MNEKHFNCDESRLEMLLHGDESSEEFRSYEEHLESCTACRNRLTKLAGDDQLWEDVSSLLGGYEATNESLAAQRKSSTGDWKHAIDFLSPPSHPETLGRLGRYEIERVIGTGGMGVVLKGHDTELNRPVAIKVLAPFLAHSGAARQRFSREGRAAAAIVHEHVVAIHNVETAADTPYLVMQYVPGESLQTRVDEQGPLAVKEILRIGIQAASGLAAAHAQGVVHRDIKPSNILLENDVDRALLTDFGLARAADDATLTRSGVITGTPHYMSPEQASGGTINERSDLFSLGALLYFMATGHPPFRAEGPLVVLNRIVNDRHRTVWEVNPEIPDDLSDVIDRLLQKRPDRRFRSAEQVRDVLLKLLETIQQPGAKRRSLHLRRTLRKRMPLLMLGAAALVGVAVVAVFVSGIFDREPPPIEPNENSSAGQSIAEALEAARQVQADLQTIDVTPTETFRNSLKDVERELTKLEAFHFEARREGSVGDSDWDRQLEELRQRLTEAEKLQFNNSLSTGANR